MPKKAETSAPQHQPSLSPVSHTPLSFSAFVCVLTNRQPFANYRGENEGNRTPLQKIQWRGRTHPIVSDAAIKNALRDTMARRGLPCNRSRLHDQEQPTVIYKEFPHAGKYVDDFFFGYMSTDRDAAKQAGQPGKRDAILGMNLGLSVEPYEDEALLRQAPARAGEVMPAGASLLHTEVLGSALQYPLALRGSDVQAGPREWTVGLMDAIADPDFRNARARSLFDLSPRSVVARLTPRLSPEFDSYGFTSEGTWGELERLRGDGTDLPAGEFFLGGEVVRLLAPEVREQLQAQGARLFENPGQLLRQLGAALYDTRPEPPAHG